MTGRKRLGILGGSFDPIHIGHLVAADSARHALRLDSVLLMVAAYPWQKAAQAVTDAEVRFAAVAAAVADVDGMEASRMELDRPGPSYMADTLAALGAARPNTDLVLIVGTDVAASLHTWERPEEVASRADLAVVNRPGVDRPALGPMWRRHEIEIPPLDISSTDLRARLASGRPVNFLIPRASVVFFRPDR